MSEDDPYGLIFILILVFGIILMVAGLARAVDGDVGSGLMVLGTGCLIAGVGGSLTFQNGTIAIGGTGGFALIVIGAMVEYLVR